MLDVLRMVTDWLGNATYGVDAKLTALDYDGSDVKPTGTLTIGDETRSAQVGAGNYPSETFGLMVQVQPMDTLDGQSATYTHDYDVPLLLRLCRQDSNPANATRDLLYTLRATVQCIETLFDPNISAAVTARTRNGVQAYSIVSMGQALIREQREDNKVTAAIAVTIRARDTLA
jgi:hypothetical protein